MTVLRKFMQLTAVAVVAMLMVSCADEKKTSSVAEKGNMIPDGAVVAMKVNAQQLFDKVAGDPDCLVFPNIESGNVFYKANSKLVPGVRQAGMLVGAKVPCVLSSRADSTDTKLNSIAVAAMSV